MDDNQLWELVEAYEEASKQAKTADKLRSEIKGSIMAELESRKGKCSYQGRKRVRMVDTKSRDFSTTHLREKFGDDFVDENSIVRTSTSLEIKYMAKAPTYKA